MTSYSVSRGSLFCTPEDVRIKSRLIMSQLEDVTEGDLERITDSQVEAHIVQASALVKGVLEGVYGGESALLTDTPYTNRPYPDPGNKNKIELRDVQISSSAVTEKWTINLLTPTSSETIMFSVEGTVSGSQGSGDSDDDFESTNNHIKILTTYWYNPLNEKSNEGDKIYFSTYNAKSSIMYITSCLAAGGLLNSELSEMSPNASSLGGKLIAEANRWLDKYCSGAISLTSIPDIVIETIAIPYQIDSIGEDDTDYLTTGVGQNNPDVIGFDA